MTSQPNLRRLEVLLSHLRKIETGIEENAQCSDRHEILEAERLLLSFTAAHHSQILRDEELFRGWASQPEEHSYKVTVVSGSIPSALRGTLYRNGPGLLNVYGTPLVHPIDGDGLVCSIFFDGSQTPMFRSQYVKTAGYTSEKQAQKMLLKGLMGTVPPNSEDGLKRYKNPSNTNVYYWGGKVLSVWESGLPYRLDPKTLETIGKETLGGALADAKSLGAHFRYDPTNHRLVSFSIRVNVGKSTLWIHEFDDKWNVLSQQAHTIDDYYYCHDFLITKNYYIVHHSPFYNYTSENLSRLLSGETSPGELVRYYPEVPSRFILISRKHPEKIMNFDTDPCHIYHHCNAYEDGDKIFFSSVCLPKNFNMKWDHSYWLSNASVAPGQLYSYTMNLTTQKLERTLVEESSCEFPSIHPGRNGEKWRYSYLMAAAAPNPCIPYQEIIKYDNLGKGRQVWSSRNERAVIGEPIFVPKKNYFAQPPQNDDYDPDEDDGWVITQVFRPDDSVTQFVILDAKNLSAGPIARLQLKTHIPYGFHGTFSPLVC